ncbi:MAG: hypothetical protein KF764_08650 [Labilithrix sp.]|nr:hypothetical protein [Labilithrix sp.]
MARSTPILSDAEANLVAAVLGVVPGLARLIADALAGDEEAVREVREILPKRGASAAAGDELRARRGG